MMEKQDQSKKRSNAGRKSDFKTDYVELAYNYTLLGATDDDLADFFSVSKRTINTWKKKHPEFLHSIKKGKDQADALVASRLFKRAIGYDYKETMIERQGRKIKSKKVTDKHMAPDTTAQIFWLKNRQSDKWRDSHKLDGSLNLNINPFFELMKQATDNEGEDKQ